MKVASKMALRTFVGRREGLVFIQRFLACSLKGSYHRDTIRTMDACEESGSCHSL
ncbi:hypothetical protein C8R41DRAFT_808504 [Lentinula lateritia]|uniref:Uncharacterized protein n=1 Tax=Lentinula lateritia TaxID=40482 RepID=A0ABQ8VXE7_9AGAR|nr:hypothetical protein C8R41DRAFT_808504 [Lentinula lateritia]